MEYSINDLVACVRRELGQRKRVYRRLVEEGRMKPEDAIAEITMMEAIRDNLEAQQQPRLF